MKKKILFILSMMLLMGCQSSQQPINKITLTQPATLLYFILKHVQNVNLSRMMLSILQETFGDSLTIQQYDLDDEATQAIYEDVITQLDQFDQSLYGMGPMYALDGYFAKLAILLVMKNI